tara:strand:- start:77 stop:715 length:639 start_codon:yes stop_codon:yes gene_type:complete
MAPRYTRHNDFSMGRIYKIESPNLPGQVYHGSTLQTETQRLWGHKTDKIKDDTSWVIIVAGDVTISSYAYPCGSLEELEDEEARVILANWDGCVNKNIPGALRRAGSMKVYNHLPEVKAKRQAYLKSDEYKAKGRAQINCICGTTHTRAHTARHLRTKVHMEFTGNLDSYVPPLPRSPRPITNCDCGGTYQYNTRSRHFKTKKHLDFLALCG